MKKLLSFIISAAFFTASIFSEEIKIYAPVAQNFLEDEKNYVRYSPINAFDNNPDTVFAVTYDQINPAKPLLEIYFAEPAAFNRLTIKAGYFNDKYFSTNNRIKDLRIKIMNCSNTEYDQKIQLKDSKTEQEIYSGNNIIASKIIIYALSVYSGTKYNDLVISDLNFYENENLKKTVFDKGSCVYSECRFSYTYDDQSRLIKKHSHFGHAGAQNDLYKYENGKIYHAIIGMDDEGQEPEYKEVDSVEEKSKGEELFYKDGLIAARKYSNKNFLSGINFCIDQYIYDENKRIKATIRICENENFAEKYKEYTYNEKGLLEEITTYEDATIYKERYE